MSWGTFSNAGRREYWTLFLTSNGGLSVGKQKEKKNYLDFQYMIFSILFSKKISQRIGFLAQFRKKLAEKLSVIAFHRMQQLKTNFDFTNFLIRIFVYCCVFVKKWWLTVNTKFVFCYSIRWRFQLKPIWPDSTLLLLENNRK